MKYYLCVIFSKISLPANTQFYVAIKAIEIQFSLQNKNILNVAGTTVLTVLLAMNITGFIFMP
jgi:hypothetical protein